MKELAKYNVSDIKKVRLCGALKSVRRSITKIDEIKASNIGFNHKFDIL